MFWLERLTAAKRNARASAYVSVIRGNAPPLFAALGAKRALAGDPYYLSVPLSWLFLFLYEYSVTAAWISKAFYSVIV